MPWFTIINSNLQHTPPGIPRAFDYFPCLGSGVCDSKGLQRVGNLNFTWNFDWKWMNQSPNVYTKNWSEHLFWGIVKFSARENLNKPIFKRSNARGIARGNVAFSNWSAHLLKNVNALPLHSTYQKTSCFLNKILLQKSVSFHTKHFQVEIKSYLTCIW